jgi:hypothetical protein
LKENDKFGGNLFNVTHVLNIFKDIAGFFFRMSTQIKAEVRSTKAVTLRTSAVT